MIHAFPAITRLNQRARTTNIPPTNTSVTTLTMVMVIHVFFFKREKMGLLRGGEGGRISILRGAPRKCYQSPLFLQLLLALGRKVLQVYKCYLFVYWVGKVPSERKGCSN